MNDARSFNPLHLALGLVGLAGVAGAYFVDPQRFGANWLIWTLALLSVSLGALFIVALEHLTRAQWSITLRRVPERLAGLLPVLLPLFLLGAWFGISHLFPWAGEEFQARVHHDPHMHSKGVWFGRTFFVGRLLFCFAVWLLSWRLLAGGSIRQDESRDPRFNLRAKRFSAPFMWLFAVTVTLIAVDWLMSMSPMWYSTIFGVYLFSGVLLSGLAATVLWVAALKRRGRLSEVRPDHLYGLGGLMFAFTIFWAYIAFSQFMLIWYANLPEEAFWFKARLTGGWYPVTISLSLIRFIVPFWALLGREAKSDLGRLSWVAALILAGQLLDLYWIIVPELGRGPLFGWQELAFGLFFTGLGLLAMAGTMKRGRDLPVGDPNRDLGLKYHL